MPEASQQWTHHPPWVTDRSQWISSITPAVPATATAGETPGETRIHDFHGMTPHSAAAELARLQAASALIDAAPKHSASTPQLQFIGQKTEFPSATDNTTGPTSTEEKMRAEQKARAEQQKRTAEQGTQSPPPATAPPPAISTIDPHTPPTDPPYYHDGPGLLTSPPPPPRLSFHDPSTGETGQMEFPSTTPPPGVIITPGGTVAVDNFDGTSWESAPVNPAAPNAARTRRVTYRDQNGDTHPYTATYDEDGNLVSLLDDSGTYLGFEPATARSPSPPPHTSTPAERWRPPKNSNNSSRSSSRRSASSGPS